MRMRRLAIVLGVVLLLGGTAHTVGVTHHYAVKGWPDLNRILLDVWIAESQVAAGGLFLVSRGTSDPRPWVLGAALVVWLWAVPFLPVLVHRAPPIFWVMPALYSVASLFLVLRSRTTRSVAGADVPGAA